MRNRESSVGQTYRYTGEPAFRPEQNPSRRVRFTEGKHIKPWLLAAGIIGGSAIGGAIGYNRLSHHASEPTPSFSPVGLDVIPHAIVVGSSRTIDVLGQSDDIYPTTSIAQRKVSSISRGAHIDNVHILRPDNTQSSSEIPMGSVLCDDIADKFTEPAIYKEGEQCRIPLYELERTDK